MWFILIRFSLSFLLEARIIIVSPRLHIRITLFSVFETKSKKIRLNAFRSQKHLRIRFDSVKTVGVSYLVVRRK